MIRDYRSLQGTGPSEGREVTLSGVGGSGSAYELRGPLGERQYRTPTAFYDGNSVVGDENLLGEGMFLAKRGSGKLPPKQKKSGKKKRKKTGPTPKRFLVGDDKKHGRSISGR